MEKDTVCIGTEEYLDLIDFKRNMEAGSVNVWGYPFAKATYISTDEAVENIAKANKVLAKKIMRLESKTLESTVDEIKKMSIWQFIKWRNP